MITWETGCSDYPGTRVEYVISRCGNVKTLLCWFEGVALSTFCIQITGNGWWLGQIWTLKMMTIVTALDLAPLSSSRNRDECILLLLLALLLLFFSKWLWSIRSFLGNKWNNLKVHPKFPKVGKSLPSQTLPSSPPLFCVILCLAMVLLVCVCVCSMSLCSRCGHWWLTESSCLKVRAGTS